MTPVIPQATLVLNQRDFQGTWTDLCSRSLFGEPIHFPQRLTGVIHIHDVDCQECPEKFRTEI